MTKNKKKTRRHFNLTKFSIVLFVFSGFLFFMTALFLRTYNNSLSTKAQAINSDIATLETQNDALQVDIETLSSSERVEGIAASNGMSRNQDAIITITNSSVKE